LNQSQGRQQKERGTIYEPMRNKADLWNNGGQAVVFSEKGEQFHAGPIHSHVPKQYRPEFV